MLYVIIIACGLFAEIGVRSQLIEPGDPSATAQNIIDSPMLFRAGLAADIVMFIADVAIAVVLYQLLKPLGRTLALLAAAFRMTQTAVIGLNLLNMFQAVRILDDADYLGTFGADQTDTLALLYLDAHKYGYILGLAFFGVSTLIVGYLALSSRQMPRPLGVLLVLAGAGYLIDTFSFFLIPGYDGSASAIVLAPALVAEIWFALWLLTKGRRLEHLTERDRTAVPSTRVATIRMAERVMTTSTAATTSRGEPALRTATSMEGHHQGPLRITRRPLVPRHRPTADPSRRRAGRRPRRRRQSRRRPRDARLAVPRPPHGLRRPPPQAVRYSGPTSPEPWSPWAKVSAASTSATRSSASAREPSPSSRSCPHRRPSIGPTRSASKKPPPCRRQRSPRSKRSETPPGSSPDNMWR